MKVTTKYNRVESITVKLDENEIKTALVAHIDRLGNLKPRDGYATIELDWTDSGDVGSGLVISLVFKYTSEIKPDEEG